MLCTLSICLPSNLGKCTLLIRISADNRKRVVNDYLNPRVLLRKACPEKATPRHTSDSRRSRANRIKYCLPSTVLLYNRSPNTRLFVSFDVRTKMYFTEKPEVTMLGWNEVSHLFLRKAADYALRLKSLYDFITISQQLKKTI